MGGAALKVSGMENSPLVSGAGTAMSLAGGAAGGLMKTATAIKAVTDSDAYKYLQSKGLDPISLAGGMMEKQGGAVGAAGGMLKAAANGDSTFEIAKAGAMGALGPSKTVVGALLGGKKEEEKPKGYFATAIEMAKKGYGLISGKQIEEELAEEEEEKSAMSSALGMAAGVEKGAMSSALGMAAGVQGVQGPAAGTAMKLATTAMG